MRTPLRLLVATALLALPALARADSLRASLQPADDQPAGEAWRRARLTLTNPTSTEAAAVRIRAAAGGPARLVPILLPPGSEAEIDVLIPALRSLQPCRIDLLASTDPLAQPIATGEATIDWPAALLSPDIWHGRAAYQNLNLPSMSWPARTRKLLLLLGALFVAGLVRLTIFRPTSVRVRLIYAVVLVVAVAVGLWQLWPDLTRVVRVDPAGEGLAVRTRRTQMVAVPLSRSDGPAMIPVYATPNQFRQDPLVVNATDTALIELQPGKVRLFQPPAAGE